MQSTRLDTPCHTKKLAFSTSWKSQEDLFTYSLLLRSVVPQLEMFYIEFFRNCLEHHVTALYTSAPRLSTGSNLCAEGIPQYFLVVPTLNPISHHFTMKCTLFDIISSTDVGYFCNYLRRRNQNM